MAIKKDKEQETNKVAVFAQNSLYYTGLPRLEKGYTIVTTDEANRWMKISSKVREASPQELAVFFEV